MIYLGSIFMITLNDKIHNIIHIIFTNFSEIILRNKMNGIYAVITFHS